jgi:hypothetical protein
MPEPKRYLGDGVYVEFDGYAIVLTTENGLRITNRVVLEPPVYNALVEYVEHLQAVGRTTTGTD